MVVDVVVVALAAFALLGFVLVGGPMLAVDWFRKRRRVVTEHQITLTEALDAELGPIVAPVVRKPLFRPWEIRIAVPFLQSAALARMVSVVDDVFSGVDGGRGLSYRIVLSAKQDGLRETRRRHAHRSPKRWAGNPVGAA